MGLLVISGWGNPMVWLFEGGVAEGECVAHGCFDGYAEQVADPADVAAGGRGSLGGCGLREGLVVRGWCCARGIAPTGVESGALLRVRNRCPSMLPGQVAVRWSRPARNERAGAVDPRDCVPCAKAKTSAHRDDYACARGLLLCTVRPGSPAAKSTGAVECVNVASTFCLLRLRRGQPVEHANRGCVPRKAARRQRTASAGWDNSAAFHQLAGDGHVSINAGAFADNTKQMVVDSLRAGALISRTRRLQPGYSADRPRWFAQTGRVRSA